MSSLVRQIGSCSALSATASLIYRPPQFDCAITTSALLSSSRDYGVGGQLDLEPSVGGWVDEMRLALGGPSPASSSQAGSLKLNLGDTYSRHPKYGARRARASHCKPERLLLALADDGWIVRNRHLGQDETQCLIRSATGSTNSWSPGYFLGDPLSPSYWFDLDAIRLLHRSSTTARQGQCLPAERASAPIWRQRRRRQSRTSRHSLAADRPRTWEKSRRCVAARRAPASMAPALRHLPTRPQLMERPLLWRPAQS